MGDCFLFVGDPGSEAREKLKILDNVGLSAKRLPPDAAIDAIVESSPHLIVLGDDIESLPNIVVSLRERKELSSVPLVSRLTCLSPQRAEIVFRSGCDDILVDGAMNQFRALVSIFAQKDNDSWSGMRAPAGLVVLGHEDRLTRMRLGQVLRKNGFDIHFAGNNAELEKAIAIKDPRAVIVASSLSGESSLSCLMASKQLPCIVISPSDELEHLSASVSKELPFRFLDVSSDAESLTFVLNDLLAPEQKSERRTPRILYGNIVSFRPENGEYEEEFFGYLFNVNIGGIFVRTLTPPALQSRLLVNFSPPHGRGKVELNAQVVWLKKFGQNQSAATPEGMGLQFLDSAYADIVAYEAGYEKMRKDMDNRSHSYASKPPGPVS